MDTQSRSTELLEPDKLLGDAIAFWYLLTELGEGDPYDGVAEYRRLVRLADESCKANIRDFLKVVIPHLPGAAQHLMNYCPESLFVRGTVADTAEVIGKCLVASCGQSLGAMSSLYMRAFWYESGMPVIQMGHKLAASLILTNVPEPVLEGLKLPFQCMRIDIPEGMLPMDGAEGKKEYLRSVLVGRYISKEGEGIAYVTYSDGESNMWNIQANTLNLLRSESSPSLQQEAGPLDYALDEQDERTTVLLKRLIANTLIYLTEGGKQKTVGKNHTAWAGDRRKSKRPLKRIFQLTQKVQHDFREVVTRYADGTGRRLSVQSIVIGHWKNQRCGPQGKERKRIFVEPYWRGPEDAPIASRPHQVKNSENQR